MEYIWWSDDLVNWSGITCAVGFRVGSLKVQETIWGCWKCHVGRHTLQKPAEDLQPLCRGFADGTAHVVLLFRLGLLLFSTGEHENAQWRLAWTRQVFFMHCLGLSQDSLLCYCHILLKTPIILGLWCDDNIYIYVYIYILYIWY